MMEDKAEAQLNGNEGGSFTHGSVVYCLFSCRAKRCWDMENAAEKHNVSVFQREISETLLHMGVFHVFEHTEGDYSIDMAILSRNGSHKVAVEADGPSHFARNDTWRPLGPTLFKKRIMEKLGWQVVQVPHFEWAKLLTEGKRQHYLLDRIGIDLLELQHGVSSSSNLSEPQLQDCNSMDDTSMDRSNGEVKIYGKDTSQAVSQHESLDDLEETTKDEIARRGERLRAIHAQRGSGDNKMDVLKQIAVKRGLRKKASD